jgi:prepilin-type N-terminal cleavage/methylation domain-containing protein
MSSRRPTRGFTLIEALAALVVLGLLAAAVVPAMRSIGGDRQRERWEAQNILRLLAAQDRLVEGVQTAGLPPGLRVEITALAAGPEPAPPGGMAPPAAPAHRWLLVRVRGPDGGILAETLAAAIP